MRVGSEVVIPTLPRGRLAFGIRNVRRNQLLPEDCRTLIFNCVSTWGDKDFVGLAGVASSVVVYGDPLNLLS